MEPNKFAVLLAEETSITSEKIDTPAAIQALHTAVINLITGLQNVILLAGGGLVVIALIIAGFRYMTGDAKHAKSAITAAIIGLTISLFSYSIIKFVCFAFERQC